MNELKLEKIFVLNEFCKTEVQKENEKYDKRLNNGIKQFYNGMIKLK